MYRRKPDLQPEIPARYNIIKLTGEVSAGPAQGLVPGMRDGATYRSKSHSQFSKNIETKLAVNQRIRDI